MAVLAYIIAFRNYYFPKNNDLTTIPSDHQINEAQKHAKGWRLLPSRTNSENLNERAIEELEKHIEQQMNDLNQEPIPQQRAAAAADNLLIILMIYMMMLLLILMMLNLYDELPVPQHLDDPNNENSAKHTKYNYGKTWGEVQMRCRMRCGMRSRMMRRMRRMRRRMRRMRRRIFHLRLVLF